MPVGAAIGIGSVGSALIGSSAAKSAASTQASAAQQASQNQLEMFSRMQQMLQPYVGGGVTAQNRLFDLLGIGPTSQKVDTSGYLAANPDLEESYNSLVNGTADPAALQWFQSLPPEARASLQSFGDWHYQNFGKQESRPGITTTEVDSQGNPITGQGSTYGSLLKNYPAFQAPPAFKPFEPKDLENTPGYKFALDQGLKAVQNGFASRGLGSSGAAMKGAADYAIGQASTTYNQQLQNYLTQNQQGFNQYLAGQGQGWTQDFNQRQMLANLLMGPYNTGANTGSSLAGTGVASQTAAGNYLTGGAAAQAAGQVGSANAWGGALNNLMMYSLLQPGAFGSSASSLTPYNANVMSRVADPMTLGR